MSSIVVTPRRLERMDPSELRNLADRVGVGYRDLDAQQLRRKLVYEAQ